MDVCDDGLRSSKLPSIIKPPRYRSQELPSNETKHHSVGVRRQKFLTSADYEHRFGKGFALVEGTEFGEEIKRKILKRPRKKKLKELASKLVTTHHVV